MVVEELRPNLKEYDSTLVGTSKLHWPLRRGNSKHHIGSLLVPTANLHMSFYLIQEIDAKSRILKLTTGVILEPLLQVYETVQSLFNHQIVFMPTDEPQESKRYVASIDDYLETYNDDLLSEEKDFKAVNMFLLSDDGKIPRFNFYSGKYKQRAMDVLERARICLDRIDLKLLLFFRGASESELFKAGEGAVGILNLFRTSFGSIARKLSGFFRANNDSELFKTASPLEYKVFDRICDALRVKCQPTLSQENVQAALTKWTTDIAMGLWHLRQLSPYFSSVDQANLMEQIFAAKRCNDDLYMRKFLNLLSVIGGMREDDGLPFVCICAPSGSGKSTFGVNLGEYAPSLHWLHNSASQRAYVPFRSISEGINDAVVRDIEANIGHFSVTDTSASLRSVKKHFSSKPLESVHLVVNMFEQLATIKEENPRLSWLEAQMHLVEIPRGKMLIKDGKLAVESLAKKFKFPVSVFIDEHSSSSGRHNGNAFDMEDCRLQFTRTFLRAINVIPILTGTNACAINFCAQPGIDSRDADDVWCFIVNDLPPFNREFLNTRSNSIMARVKDSPTCSSVDRVLKFLRAVRLYENPWLIELALKYLEWFDCAKFLPLRTLLDRILCSLSLQFISRKGQFRSFTLGQIAYLMSHNLDKNGLLRVNSFDDSCINGHLGHLVGIQDYYGDPFISLGLTRNLLYYYCHENDPFKPRSYFTPFFLAPLTGLMLFGLNMSDQDYKHVPFVGDLKDQRITAFDAVYRSFPKSTYLTSDGVLGGRNTGTRTEILYHAAVVLASRAKGLKGCSLLEFLESFANELETNCLLFKDDDVDDGAEQNSNYNRMKPKLLIINAKNNFGHRKVPILAPMSVPGWPKSVVDLLKDGEVGGDQVIYGVFRPSTSNEPVDCVICECGEAARPKFNPPKVITIKPETDKLIQDVSGKFRQTRGQKRSADGHIIVQPPKSPLINTGRASEEKHYGFLGASHTASESVPNKVLIAGECKQFNDDLTLSRLPPIVKKFNTVPNCKTFIILALSLSDFNQKASYSSTLKRHDPSADEEVDMRVIESLNLDGYYFWFFDNGPNDNYELKPVPGQLQHEESLKDVIMAGCGTFLGRTALEQVRREWCGTRGG